MNSTLRTEYLESGECGQSNRPAIFSALAADIRQSAECISYAYYTIHHIKEIAIWMFVRVFGIIISIL